MAAKPIHQRPRKHSHLLQGDFIDHCLVLDPLSRVSGSGQPCHACKIHLSARYRYDRNRRLRHVGALRKWVVRNFRLDSRNLWIHSKFSDTKLPLHVHSIFDQRLDGSQHLWYRLSVQTPIQHVLGAKQRPLGTVDGQRVGHHDLPQIRYIPAQLYRSHGSDRPLALGPHPNRRRPMGPVDRYFQPGRSRLDRPDPVAIHAQTGQDRLHRARGGKPSFARIWTESGDPARLHRFGGPYELVGKQRFRDDLAPQSLVKPRTRPNALRDRHRDRFRRRSPLAHLERGESDGQFLDRTAAYRRNQVPTAIAEPLRFQLVNRWPPSPRCNRIGSSVRGRDASSIGTIALLAPGTRLLDHPPLLYSPVAPQATGTLPPCHRYGNHQAGGSPEWVTGRGTKSGCARDRHPLGRRRRDAAAP
jgi:hypothetical protein